MAVRVAEVPPSLYERDETAWLEAMADSAREGRVEDLDLVHLAEYLSDMARRDRREVETRLIVLMTHLLKWEYQPGQRSRSWRATVVEQRRELIGLAAQGVLRRHAEDVMAKVYPDAIEQASAETGISARIIPAVCPFDLEGLFSVELEAGDV